jgi:hypothetical protein
VTNALQHAEGGAITLGIGRAHGEFRVDVHDTAARMPRPTQVAPDAEAGRGLMLVARLSAGGASTGPRRARRSTSRWPFPAGDTKASDPGPRRPGQPTPKIPPHPAAD